MNKDFLRCEPKVFDFNVQDALKDNSGQWLQEKNCIPCVDLG